MSLRFGPDVRLRARREYLAVQEQGRRISSRYVTVLALPNTLGRDRLGVVASKKIGGAVVRNRAKRRIREIFRRTRPETTTEPRRGYDLVVIARQDLPRAPFDAVRSDVAAVLGRVGRSRP